MNEKIKILFTIPNFETAGSQYVLLAIYERLDRTKFKPFVMVEKFSESIPNTIQENELLYLNQHSNELKNIVALSCLLRKHNINILHSWDYKSEAIEVIACRLANVKYIYTKKNNSWSKRWFLKSCLSHHIAYDNPYMLEHFFSSKCLNRKVSFIPHGIDTKKFKPLPKRNNVSKFVIVCLGVLNKNKNQLFILKALKKLPKHNVVEFYGKADSDHPSYEKSLTNYILDYNLQDRVTFRGFVKNEEIPRVMRSVNVLVLASKNEGLPLCLIEAMACGIPVLSSDSGGGAKHIIGNNEGGFIFNLDNENRFVDMILQLQNTSNNLSKNLSFAGVNRVRAHFTIEKEVEAYQKLYQQI